MSVPDHELELDEPWVCKYCGGETYNDTPWGLACPRCLGELVAPGEPEEGRTMKTRYDIVVLIEKYELDDNGERVSEREELEGEILKTYSTEDEAYNTLDLVAQTLAD